MKPVASDSPAPVPPAGRERFFVRYRKRLLTIAIALLAAVIGIRALLPALIERGVAFGSRYVLGLPARIENVDLGVFKGTIVLEGLSLGPAADGLSPTAAAFNPPELDASTALLHIDRIAVDLSWRDLLKKRVRLTELLIDTPSLRLVREADGAIDPLRHAKPVQAESPNKKTPSEPASLPPLLVEQLALRKPSVRIVDTTGQVNLLEFSLQSFALSDVSLEGRDFALGDIAVHGPELRVKKELLAEAEAAGERLADPPPATAPADAAPAAMGGYRIKSIAIEDAKFTWLSKEGPLEAGFTLKASGITTAPGQPFPIDLSISIGRSSIRLTGETGILPPSFKGDATWQHVTFPPLLLAARPELAAWLRSADSSGEVKVDANMGSAGARPGLRVSGRGTLDGFAMSDPVKSEVSLEWEQVEVAANDLFIPLPEPSKPMGTITADFSHVRVKGPRIRYTHPTSALDSLLGAPAPAGSGGPAPASDAPLLRLAIGSLEVNGAEIELHDTTVKPATTSPVRDLSLSVKDLKFPDPSASVISLRATLPTASLLTVEGGLRPGLHGSFVVALEELDLPSFSSYATSAAGASLDAGRVSVKTRLETQGFAIKAESDLVLRKIGVSLRNPESFSREFGMPVDLVIALLSDPAGDIRLSVPIQMDEKGASFSAGPVIGSAVKAAILGAVSSPLKLLGAGFAAIPGMPGSALSIAPIKSLPGTPELAPDAPKRVESLVKLLAQRPVMTPVFRGRSGPADHPFLAEQILNERLKARDGLPEVPGIGPLASFRMRQLLARRAKGNTSPLPGKDQALFNRYLDAVEIPQERLDALAKSRAEKARELLISKGVNAKRITIGAPEDAGDPGVVISFGPTAPAAAAKKPKN